MREYWAIGLMTGTALDGFVDVALIRTDGQKTLELGSYALIPYSDTKRDILAAAVQAALDWQFIGPAPAIFIEATEIVTQIYAEAIRALLHQSGFARGKVDYIGAHGLTVLHHPPKKR